MEALNPIDQNFTFSNFISGLKTKSSDEKIRLEWKKITNGSVIHNKKCFSCD